MVSVANCRLQLLLDIFRCVRSLVRSRQTELSAKAFVMVSIASFDFTLVEAEETTSTRAAANWRRLLKTASRVRRLQRAYGQLGQFLQTFGTEMRALLRSVYKKE